MQDSSMQVREVVNARDPAIIMLVATPLPWPLDGEKVTQKLFCTSMMLRSFCDVNSTLQYVCASQEFVSLEGVNQVMVDQSGLTRAGIQTINKLITAKIECSKLRKEYELLAAKNT